MGWGRILGRGMAGAQPLGRVGGGIMGGLGGSTAASVKAPVPTGEKTNTVMGKMAGGLLKRRV